MPGGAVALLAAALLLLPVAGWAQVALVFSKGSLTVPEDGSTSESYGVKLGRQPDAGVTVTVTVTATDQPVTVDRSTLSFTMSNWSKVQSVTVTGAKDDVDNPDDTRTATITHTGTGVATSTVTVSVTDDDTAGLSILPTTGLTVYEDGRAAYLQVKLTSAPSATSEVKVEITATPATVTFGAGADSTLTVTFAVDNWNRYQQVQVNAAPDDVDNPGDSRSTAIELDPTDDSSGRYNEVTSVRMTVTIEDDDTKSLTLSPKTVNVTEGNDSTNPSKETYTVRLNSKPSRDVRVDITSLDPKIARVSAPGVTAGAATTSLTFTLDNWRTEQTVTVHSVPDEVDNDGRSVRIKHVAHSGGYDGVGAESEVTITDDDETGLTVGEPSEALSENGMTTAAISVALKSKPTGNVRVTARSTDTKVAKVAVEKSDGTGLGTPMATATLTFTPDNWSTEQTVTVSGVEDKVEDTGGRMVDISFTATGGGYRSITEKKTVTVESDNDVSGISVANFPSTLEEGGAGTSYNVSLADPPTGNVTVTIRSTDTKVAKVAVEKSDGTLGTPAATASLTFTPQNSGTAQTVTVFGVDNDVAANRTATIIHTASSSRIANDGTGKHHRSVTVTNESDDKAGLMPSESEINIKEGARDTYTIKLTSEPTDDVTVEVSSANPDIATATPNTLKFTSGNWKNPRTVTVVGTNNDVDEGSTKPTSIEHIVSSDGEDYGSAQNDNVQVVVIDDDNAGLTVVPTVLTISEGRTDTFTVKLNTKPEGGVRLTAGSDDDSIAEVTPKGRDFTPDNWHIPQEFAVTGMRSSHIGGRRFTGITISAADVYNASSEYVDVTVTDEDIVVVPPGLTVTPTSLTVSEGQTGTYTVKLNARPRGSVTVTAASSDTAAATVSPESRTFTIADWDTAQTFTVTGTASSDRAATITNTASGRGYEDVSARVSVTVQANGLVLSKTAVTATEASGADHTDTYTVKLKTQPTGTVTVAVASSDTAAATVSPASLTFTTSDWSTAKTVTVTGVDDSTTNAGGERSTTITHNPAGGGYDAVATESVSVTVTDIPAGLVLSKNVVTVTEASGAGNTDTYTVKLKTQPTGTVTVAVASSDTAAATVSPASLPFTTSDWSTAKTVTVTGVDDSADNAADKRTVTISNRSSSAGYNAAATVTVTVTDDDAAPKLSIEGASVPEGNTGSTTPLTFTVTKDGRTDQRVTVAYAPGTGTARAGTDYTAVAAGTLTFAPSESLKTITVMVQGDDESESDETVVIALRSPSNATIAEGKGTATGTIDDDDASRLSIEAEAASVDEGDPLIFTVTLEPPLDDEQVTVEVVTEGTATAGADYTGVPETLTFAAGEGVKTITVAVADDADYELDETVEVELRNPKPTGSVVLETGEAKAMVTIEDNDAPPVLSISGTSVAEGSAGTTSKLTFAVTKSGGTSMEATVAYADAGTGTATAGTDYTAVAAGTLTFAPDETSKTITVVVKGDDETEGDETVVIRLRSPSNATLAGGKGSATGTIIDDDTLPRVASDWLARFGRTAASATLDAIARRLNDGVVAAAPSVTVAGHRASFAPEPIAQAAAGTTEPWEESRSRVLTIEELANGSSAEVSFVEGLNVWGASGYNQFEMTPQGAYTMDGSLVSAILGVDHQGDGYVAGLALAYHGGAGDFSGIGKTEGSLGTNLYSIHPYGRLTFGEAIHVGASLGIGTGDLRITDKGGGALVETGVGMPVLAAVDARMELSLAEAWILALQADGHLVQMVADERLPQFTRVETNTHRLRLGVENSYAFLITDGVSLAPVLETGLRYDGGDAGETGLGFDIGGGLRLDATVVGLMVDARGHASLSNWGEGQEQAPALRDWGIGGVIRWRPGGGGQGPQVSLAPSYGGMLGAAAPSLDAEVGYRLPAFGGVLTPYSSAVFAGSGQRSYRAGAHLEFGHAVEVSAEGTYQQSATGDAEQFLTLRARLRQ